MCRQIELEECIRMHDPSTATHVFEHRVLGNYLLRNVEVQRDGNIYADYGVVTKRGTFLGWKTEDPEDPSQDPRPGMFLRATGTLRPARKFWADQNRARAFEKMVTFADRYSRTVG